MIAFVCSIGETTTDLVLRELQRMGFDTFLLGGKEDWLDKYKTFLNTAKEDCIRIDADVIPNEKIKDLVERGKFYKKWMVQCMGWDFYKNDVGITSPVFYSKEGLWYLRNHIKEIKKDRPETTAWRLLPKDKVMTASDLYCGIHGVYQTEADIGRHIQHKKDRKQIKDYNFSIAQQCATLGNH